MTTPPTPLTSATTQALAARHDRGSSAGTDLLAVLVRNRLDELSHHARDTIYDEVQAYADIDDLTLPTVPAWADPVWHLYVVRHARRDALSARLADAGIGTIVHYPIPPHLQQAYAELGYKEGDFPIAEAIHREVLSLPIGPHMTLEQADIVADAVRTALTNLS